ncbi:ribonuclease R [Corallococcus sp. M34]|uniref:ribonuclease R n=1 Tax=Citreicoccus inhibens TaxID=2849499 RepID=UPI001C223030|nr:ribonuclease R [Citreicoccus inhibens]MBU8898575.1 ribonuclease R [Citreicoccus inhibens]
MTLTPEHLKQLLADADHPLGVKELLRLAGLHPGQQTALKRALRDLVRQGDIAKDGKRFRLNVVSQSPRPERSPTRGGRAERERPRPPGRLSRAPASQDDWDADGESTVEGTLHVHRDGFGFVHPVSGEGENIFLPPHEAQRALDNDRVVVEVSGRPGRFEGRLIRVVERRRELAVGTYVTHGRHGLVVPTDASLPGPIRVPLTQMARDGDLVKVRLGIGANLLSPGRDLIGEVAGSLGRPGTPSAEVIGIAYSQGFSDEFPPEVMDEADAFEVRVSEEEARGEQRKDLRALPLVTIDGEDARDFDDAVYAEPHGNGWRLVVAIADVTHYVRERRALDTEALRRATSVYLPDRVLPMLPERLSNGICSLRPDEDRLCMVADMTFDARGHRRSSELYPAVMRSVARCTYNEVQDVLDDKDVPHRNAFKPHFQQLMALARALMGMRKDRGAIDFDLPEHKVVLGPDGLPERMDKRERKDSHRLIEECMLAANEAVAAFFQDEGLPTVYRFHGEPDPDKLAAFAALAQAYGFVLHIEDGVSSKELDAFVSQLEGHPEQRALNQLLLRSMMQAVYTSSRVGHYGLAAEYYLHFTSPIRRYPDLLVHRLLKAHWARKGRKPTEAQLEREEERLEDMAVQCSERERAAMQVEREVVSFYAALMMEDRVGEEFDATVAGIADFGFFVELDTVHVEGLVKAETLGPGSKLDKRVHALVYPNGRRVRVGQALRVRLVSANPTSRKIDFEALQFAGEAPLPSRGGFAPPRRRREWAPPAPAPAHRPGERAKRPGRREREAAKSGRPWMPPPADSDVAKALEALPEPIAEALPWTEPEPTRPRGRFSREGRREEAAPARGPRSRSVEAEASTTRWPGMESTPAPATPKRRMFVRPAAVPTAPSESPVSAEPTPEVPESESLASGEASPSPHPGFDRIRALASQRKWDASRGREVGTEPRGPADSGGWAPRDAGALAPRKKVKAGGAKKSSGGMSRAPKKSVGRSKKSPGRKR